MRTRPHTRSPISHMPYILSFARGQGKGNRNKIGRKRGGEGREENKANNKIDGSFLFLRLFRPLSPSRPLLPNRFLFLHRRRRRRPHHHRWFFIGFSMQ